MSWLSRLFSGTANSQSRAPVRSAQSSLDRQPPAASGIVRLAPGDQIANEFRVIKLVGEGAFGAVYLCEANDQSIAVKVFHPEKIRHADDLQRAREEGRRWAELGNYPNIVFAMGVREHARMPCIIMEYVEGAQTLADRIVTDGGNWRLALWVGAQVAAGLDHAWKTAGLLHRDIKPANILVRPDAFAKIGDFGLAMSSRIESDRLHGSRIGTPLYMAPEIWDGSVGGPAADVYAFGATLHETVSGFWPYANTYPRSIEDVIEAHRTGYAPDLRNVAPEAPEAFTALIAACLKKNPGQRPKNVGAIAAELNALSKSVLREDTSRLGTTTIISEADRLTNLVGVRLVNGDIAEARAYAEKAARLEPRNPKVWTGLSAVAGAEGRHADAVAALRKGLGLSPDARTEFLMVSDVAYCLFLLKQPAEAREWLTRAIDLAALERNYALLDGRSNLVCELLPYDQALEICDRILDADPNAAITWNNRAIICRRNGDVGEAERCARRAIEANPLYAKGWTNLANALLQQERFGEVVEAAQRALSIDKTVGGAYVALAGAYMQTGDRKRALSILQEGARVLPDHPIIRRNIDLLLGRR